jgi:hypothetical protein
MLNSNKLKIIKVFRLLRVLRPLRVVARNQGLKLALGSLIYSIPSIFNVIIIQLFFLLIVGITSVSIFKGTFYSC